MPETDRPSFHRIVFGVAVVILMALFACMSWSIAYMAYVGTVYGVEVSLGAGIAAAFGGVCLIVALALTEENFDARD